MRHHVIVYPTLDHGLVVIQLNQSRLYPQYGRGVDYAPLAVPAQSTFPASALERQTWAKANSFRNHYVLPGAVPIPLYIINGGLLGTANEIVSLTPVHVQLITYTRLCVLSFVMVLQLVLFKRVLLR